MWGRATLAIEVSSTSMNAASATVMAISHGLTRGFHCADDAASGFVTVVSCWLQQLESGHSYLQLVQNSLLCGRVTFRWEDWGRRQVLSTFYRLGIRGH